MWFFRSRVQQLTELGVTDCFLTFTCDWTFYYTAGKVGWKVTSSTVFGGFKEIRKEKTIAWHSLKELFSYIPMGFIYVQTKIDSEMCCISDLLKEKWININSHTSKDFFTIWMLLPYLKKATFFWHLGAGNNDIVIIFLHLCLYTIFSFKYLHIYI